MTNIWSWARAVLGFRFCAFSLPAESLCACALLFGPKISRFCLRASALLVSPAPCFWRSNFWALASLYIPRRGRPEQESQDTKVRTWQAGTGQSETGQAQQDRHNRTGTTEQAQQDRHNRTGRTGQAEQDKQIRTSRTGQAEQERQNRTFSTGHPEWGQAEQVRQNGTGRPEQVEQERRTPPEQHRQNSQKRTARRGHTEGDTKNGTRRTGHAERTDTKGQADWKTELDKQNWTGRTGLPGQDCPDRTVRTRLPEMACWVWYPLLCDKGRKSANSSFSFPRCNLPALFFASRSRARKREKSAGAYLSLHTYYFIRIALSTIPQ